MAIELLLLFLLAGVPYYFFFEKVGYIKKDKLFLLSALLVIIAMILATNMNFVASIYTKIAIVVTSLYSLYKAHKTTNLYKLTYYILFFNAPMLLLFERDNANLYGASLLVGLFGVFLMAKYYERSYGSANYQSVSGLMLVAPYAALILTIYFTALALYPPFPNALLFFSAILHTDISLLWYIVVVIIFLGNFLISVRIMAKTVFGKPNANVHYIDISSTEKVLHLVLFTLLMGLSVIGIQEVLS